jgi:hypothetical protein
MGFEGWISAMVPGSAESLEKETLPQQSHGNRQPSQSFQPQQRASLESTHNNQTLRHNKIAAIQSHMSLCLDAWLATSTTEKLPPKSNNRFKGQQFNPGSTVQLLSARKGAGVAGQLVLQPRNLTNCTTADQPQIVAHT